MTLNIPDEHFPLIIKALDNQYAASRALSREDGRYRDIAGLFRSAMERKGPGAETGSPHKRQAGRKKVS